MDEEAVDDLGGSAIELFGAARPVTEEELVPSALIALVFSGRPESAAATDATTAGSGLYIFR